MLALVAAVLGTVNLGHALHERIRLQNNADGAAYSMAVAEARAFNLYAFANRAQASHYVSAMLWQSTISFIFFTEAFLTDVLGVLMTLESALNHCGNEASLLWKPVCAALALIPGVAELRSALRTLTTVVQAAVKLYQQRLRVPDIDRLIGREIIPAHRALNEGLAAASTGMMLASLHEVRSGAAAMLHEADPGLTAGSAAAGFQAFNGCLFDRAHARAANGSPLAPNFNPREPLDPRRLNEDDATARAKRVMAGIANGSRFGCDANSRRGCLPHFGTSRTTAQLLPGLSAAKGLETLLRPGFRKWGQTRLLSHTMAVNPAGGDDGNMIRHHQEVPNRPQGMLAQGDNLGADDLYWLKVVPLGFSSALSCGPDQKPEECWGDPRYGAGRDPKGHPFRSMLETSVWALNRHERYGDGGLHWRVQYPTWPVPAGSQMPEGPYGELGLHRSRPCALPLGRACLLRIDLYVANVRPVRDGNHRWEGLTPFSHFEPGHFSEDCPGVGRPSLSEEARREDDFNQPSVWVRLEKSAGARRNPGAGLFAGTNAPALLNDQGTLGAEWERPLRLGLESQRTFVAISRAQTYYHRPGNWSEAPNFFNPYWRPRLAPASRQPPSLVPLSSQELENARALTRD